MEYVVAAAGTHTVEVCREALGDRAGLDFRVGSVADTGFDCDAVILSSPLAHERYGGVPIPGSAQLLVNHRGDGAPPVVIATPVVPWEEPARHLAAAEAEVRTHRILAACVDAFTAGRSVNAPGPRILIHLEGAGIDRPELSPTIGGIARLLAD
ncbi:hypothetical protein ACIA8O_14720 [Kitasatospora sp. NPDC051853]|uniref:hypothetical protein n=1 Tax=Kitasatospora sp. NPDC051853 TaxID=3364058 RepID=UPI0037A06F76